jgi:protein-disulfide isomerase
MARQRSTQGRRGQQEEEQPPPWQGLAIALVLILLVGLVSALLNLTMVSRRLASGAATAQALAQASADASAQASAEASAQAAAQTRARIRSSGLAAPLVRLAVSVSERDHARGPAAARVTLVEYGNYPGTKCAGMYPIIKHLEQAMGGRLRFVFRNYPLSGQLAAEAAEAAGAQGKFWEMHDMLYEHPAALDDADLVQYAQTIGLDVTRFRQDLTAHAYAAWVAQDVSSADASGVAGAPTFFINDIPYRGDLNYDTLLKAVQDAAENGN